MGLRRSIETERVLIVMERVREVPPRLLRQAQNYPRRAIRLRSVREDVRDQIPAELFSRQAKHVCSRGDKQRDNPLS